MKQRCSFRCTALNRGGRGGIGGWGFGGILAIWLSLLSAAATPPSPSPLHPTPFINLLLSWFFTLDFYTIEGEQGSHKVGAVCNYTLCKCISCV